MNCPKCSEGKIRVVTGVVCTCGHHPLICDKCFAQFEVECGPPYDSSKLPPEFPMKEAVLPDKPLPPELSASLPKGVTSMEELMKLATAGMATFSPLLEDFKAGL